jgi:quinoprotein glucose dehydrogenase/quinate dehydrogenase (quinone)
MSADAVRRLLAAALLAAPLAGPAVAADAFSDADWPAYGRTAGGARFSPLDQITPANVEGLEVAWAYHTGDDLTKKQDPRNLPAFEATPLKVGDSLYLCTPHNTVIALDAETGAERWRFDPKTDTRGHFLVTCRGVTYAEIAAAAPAAASAPAEAAPACRRRIFAATVDARLLALDAATGVPCPGFGKDGTISLLDGLGPVDPGTYSITSPPTVVNGVLVTGGLVLDNISTDMPSGVVRGFDAATGRLLWSWDSGADDPGAAPADGIYSRGSANAWSVFSADPELGLVFVPTGNRTPDYFGANRTEAEERYNSSVVALEAATGKVRWSFQTVHHDIWDYDIPAQPVLVDFPMPGGPVPAVIQATKQGQLFVLDRRTGAPLTPVEERRVPVGPAPGERLSPTQPFSVGMPSFSPGVITGDNMWGLTPIDRAWCKRALAKVRSEGLFTPPSLQGSLVLPNNLGASSWGSVAVDTDRQILVANTSHVASIVTLLPRAEADQREAAGQILYQPSRNTPYAALVDVFVSPLGVPCTAPPWGKLTAIDLKTRKILWERPLGTVRDTAPLPIPWELGVPNTGGTLVTRSGLVFVAATLDRYLRAFDIASGRQLWQARLPAGGNATPMSYMSEKSGQQFVVIAAGGHAHLGTRLGDAVIAYRLKR